MCIRNICKYHMLEHIELEQHLGGCNAVKCWPIKGKSVGWNVTSWRVLILFAISRV